MASSLSTISKTSQTLFIRLTKAANSNRLITTNILRTTMTSGRKLVFFGNERLVSGLDHTETPILQALIDEGYDIQAVVANNSGTKSRKARPLEVAQLAEKHDIPVHLPGNPLD